MSRLPTKRDAVRDWLKAYLANGARPQDALWLEAESLGFSDGTLRRAKVELGVESVRRGRDIYWRSPEVLEDVPGTPSLVESIVALTHTLQGLAKQAGIQPSGVLHTSSIRNDALIEPPAPKDVPDEPSVTDVWSEQDFQDATYSEICKELATLQDDRFEAEKYHGTKLRPDKLGGEPVVVDNSKTIAEFNVQIERFLQWEKVKKPVGEVEF